MTTTIERIAFLRQIPVIRAAMDAAFKDEFAAFRRRMHDRRDTWKFTSARDCNNVRAILTSFGIQTRRRRSGKFIHLSVVRRARKRRP